MRSIIYKINKTAGYKADQVIVLRVKQVDKLGFHQPYKIALSEQVFDGTGNICFRLLFETGCDLVLNLVSCSVKRLERFDLVDANRVNEVVGVIQISLYAEELMNRPAKRVPEFSRNTFRHLYVNFPCGFPCGLTICTLRPRNLPSSVEWVEPESWRGIVPTVFP